MSDHPKRPLAEMQAAAERLVEELRPFCERIAIAGSIRRRAPMVSDIELVCVPRVEKERDPADLFKVADVNRLDEYCKAQLPARIGLPSRFQHRLSSVGSPAFGARYKRLLIEGVALDLFSVLPPASWPVVLLIRTGSADFSKRCVTQRARGGRLPDDCRVSDGAVWRDGERVPLAVEADFFTLCGMRYIEPEARR